MTPRPGRDLALPQFVRHAYGELPAGRAVQDTPPQWQVTARRWRPTATYALLGTMAAVYALELVTLSLWEHNTWGMSDGFLWHGLANVWPDFLFVINTDWMWRPWTLVLSTLAHNFTDPNHLLFNGMFLFFFGPSVERLMGAKRFVLLFFAAGALSGVAQVHAVAYELTGHLNGYAPGTGALGASGALMALFGVLAAVVPTQKVALFFVLPVPLWAAAVGYAALDVFGVFDRGSKIGHFAHLSGMALGLAYGLWLKADWHRRGLHLVYQ